MKTRQSQKGFISLTLVITIASFLLAFSFAQSTEVAHFFDQVQRKNYRLMNYYHAGNCIDQLILNISHDYFYDISTPVTIPDLQCSIDIVKRENDIIMIEVRGTFKNSDVKRSATARLYDNRVEIISIE